MNIIAITQARFSSTRFPGKVLQPLGQLTVLDLHLKRILKTKHINRFIVATTNEPEAVEIESIAHRNKCACFHGSQDDVLDRFYMAASQFNADYIVRLTSDCPLIDSFLIDDLIEKFFEKKVDYAANCINPTLPDGMDAEIFSFSALEFAWANAKKKSDREHVTPFIRNNPSFNILSVEYPFDLSKIRLTLDTIEDYVLIKKLVENIGEDSTMQEYVECLFTNSEWSDINSKFERNEGYKKSLKED